MLHKRKSHGPHFNQQENQTSQGSLLNVTAPVMIEKRRVEEQDRIVFPDQINNMAAGQKIARDTSYSHKNKRGHGANTINSKSLVNSREASGIETVNRMKHAHKDVLNTASDSINSLSVDNKIMLVDKN